MAKRFGFRFATMLKIRKQREDEHKRVVAGRLREISQVRNQITSLVGKINEEMGAMRTEQDYGTIDMQQTIGRRKWLSHLHKVELDTKGHLRFLEARLSQERVGLAEATKQRRILDKLKERQQQRFLAEQERRETMEADDMVTVRYVFDRAVELSQV